MWTPLVSSYFLPGSLCSVPLNNDFAKLYLCLQSPPHPSLVWPLINFQVNSNVTSFLPGMPGIVPSFLWASAILRACRQQSPNQQFIVYVSSIRLRTEQFHFCVPISNALHSVCHAEETQWWMNDFMKWWMMISICFYFQLCKASCLLLHLWHLK